MHSVSRGRLYVWRRRFSKQWLTHTAQCRFAPVLRPRPPLRLPSWRFCFLISNATLLQTLSPELFVVVCGEGCFCESLCERPCYGIRAAMVWNGRLVVASMVLSFFLSTPLFPFSLLDLMLVSCWPKFGLSTVPAGWLMGRPVSKNHPLQRKRRLRLLSASRVPTRSVATQVSLATAARGPLPISCGETTHVQSSVVDSEECVSS